MTRTKKTLLVVPALVVLGIVGLAMQQAQSATSGAAPVSIQSPLPLPVAGTVAATQSGTWNVGIAGTPSINVANPASSPALVRNVDNSSRTFVTLELVDGQSYTVPDGKILILEQVLGSSQTFLSGSTFLLSYSGDLASGTNHNRWDLFLTPPSCLGNACSMAQPLHVYAYSGQTITVSSNTGVQLFLQGHLENASD